MMGWEERNGADFFGRQALCVAWGCVCVRCLHSSARRQRVGHCHIPEQGHCWVVRRAGKGWDWEKRIGGGLPCWLPRQHCTAEVLSRSLKYAIPHVLRFGKWALLEWLLFSDGLVVVGGLRTETERSRGRQFVGM